METKVYYKLRIIPDETWDKSCDVKLQKEYRGQLTEEDIEDILETRKAPAFWSFNPHDCGEFEAPVEIIKVTETEEIL